MNLKEAMIKLRKTTEPIAVIAFFQPVLLHEFYHYAMARLLKFNAEIRILDKANPHPDGFAAYCHIEYPDETPDYQIYLLYVAPFIFGIPLSLISCYLLSAHHIITALLLFTVITGVQDIINAAAIVGQNMRIKRKVASSI